MPNFNKHIKYTKKSIAVIFLTAMLFSCEKYKNSKILYNENEDIPLSETKNFDLTYTLYGNKVLELTAPIMLDYSTDNQFKYQYFPKKFKVVMISKKNKHTTTVIADKAYIYKNPDLTELVGNVIITNDQGASLKTSRLFWDSANNHIFGEEKTILQRGNEKIEGVGFDSSLDFKNVRINKISGQLEMKE